MGRPKRSRKGPEDLNLLLKRTVDQATSEQDQPEQRELTKEKRSAIAKILGRLGGLKGGKARAAALLPEERKAIAKKAAKKRWQQKKSS